MASGEGRQEVRRHSEMVRDTVMSAAAAGKISSGKMKARLAKVRNIPYVKAQSQVKSAIKQKTLAAMQCSLKFE